MLPGTPRVGKIVMAAAAKHLTPVTLELGGKNPCYVDDNCDPQTVANRVAFFRCFNAGQTCVAPDYVLCSPEMQARLVPALQSAITRFYGDDPQSSPNLGRIISQKHFQRLRGLLSFGRVVIGGQSDESDLYIGETRPPCHCAPPPSTPQRRPLHAGGHSWAPSLGSEAPPTPPLQPSLVPRLRDPGVSWCWGLSPRPHDSTLWPKFSKLRPQSSRLSFPTSAPRSAAPRATRPLVLRAHDSGSQLPKPVLSVCSAVNKEPWSLGPNDSECLTGWGLGPQTLGSKIRSPSDCETKAE